MPVRPLELARPVFEPYVDEIVSLVQSAHSKYLEKAGPLLKSMEDSTKRSLVRDLIVDEMRPWADRTSGIQYFRNGNLGWFGCRNNWIFRIKHTYENFSVGVSPTNASREYDRNEVPEAIAEYLIDSAPATMLYLGWHATENAPATPEVSLICNNEYAEPAWVWTLSGRAPHPGLVLPTPEAPTAPPAGGVRVRIRADREEAAKKKQQ